MIEFNYKSLSKEEAAIIFENTLSFVIEPMWHQLISLAFAADHNRVAYWHGVGTGKTLLALWTAMLWGSKKILVVCPSSAFNAWERDISKFTDFSYDFLVGSGKERKAKLRHRKNIYIINYEGLKTIFANLKKGKGWKILNKLFIHNFDCLILDEVHRCSAYNSLQSQICYKLSQQAVNTIGLTGTAFDTDLLAPFNIYKVIDLGAALGNNFFLYRQRFFKPSFFKWVIKDKKLEQRILKMMAKSTISFDRSECFDLPEIHEIVREVQPSKEFLNLQHKIITTEDVVVNRQVAYLGKSIEKENSGRKELQARPTLLRELCGGFLYYKKDKNDKKKFTYYLRKNAKLESLMDFLEDTAGKVVVFYLYTAEGEAMQKIMEKNKVQFRMIKGGQSRIEKKKSEKDFRDSPNVKCMLTQISAGSEGWDGSIANVVAFYTLVASPKVREQCIGRVHRKGQKNKCLVADFMLKHSVDKNVIKHRGERMEFVAIAKQFMKDYGGIENI
jgi:SNF2 family DNA or RNA helicase